MSVLCRIAEVLTTDENATKVVGSDALSLVMSELAIMVNPFAFYWYSFYAPVLQALDHFKATAWLDAFFLPHSVITTSPVLEFLWWHVGTYCLSFGIIGFFFCAAQIYGSKLFRSGVVHSWIYAPERTAMFIPGSPAGSFFTSFFGWIPNRSAALAATIGVTTALVVRAALLLRQYTIAHAATAILPEDRTLAIAIWPTRQQKIQEVVSVAL